MPASGGGVFGVDLDGLGELTEQLARFSTQTAENTAAIHRTVDETPMEGEVKKAFNSWADRWCSLTDEDLAKLAKIRDWARTAHANYTQACEANTALWAT